MPTLFAWNGAWLMSFFGPAIRIESNSGIARMALVGIITAVGSATAKPVGWTVWIPMQYTQSTKRRQRAE